MSITFCYTLYLPISIIVGLLLVFSISLLLSSYSIYVYAFLLVILFITNSYLLLLLFVIFYFPILYCLLSISSSLIFLPYFSVFIRQPSFLSFILYSLCFTPYTYSISHIKKIGSLSNVGVTHIKSS